MRSKSILVVEDDMDIARQIVTILQLEDYSVEHFPNGKLALDYLLTLDSNKLPDCIILDLMMPVMDGESFLKEIRGTYADQLRGLKVLVATAKGALSQATDNLSGIQGKLRKPFDLEELLSAIEKLTMA